MSQRARTNIIRAIVAVAAIAGVGWFVKSRSKHGGSSEPVMVEGSAQAANGSGGGGGKSDKSERVVPVQIAVAEQQDLPVWLEGLGTVQAFQQVTVRAQVDGRLDKVLFTEGKPVKAGDVIAQIDPRPFRVQLLQAQGALARDKAQLDSMKKQYERLQTLKQQNLIAQQQVDELAGQFGALEGTVKIDQATVENALLQLDYAQVKAPLDGITGVRLVDAGNLVHASDANGLVVITSINPTAVMFTIPQDKLQSVVAAQAKGDVKVEVYNRDGSQKLGEGKLAVLDNQVNSQTSTLRLKAIVDNPDHALWPNAFVKARMLAETRKGALVVPAVAIQRGPQGAYVYAIGADKTAAMKPVKVDLLTSDRAVISDGIAAGDQVVTEGASQLRPGGKVEVVQPDKDKKKGGGKEKGEAGKGSDSPRADASGRSRGSAAGPASSNKPAPP
ncbi:MAG TPA: efflux RND transporter periplasmic adaptor subunit [Kofleriaceae bacterium]|jgi:multidrug efflux system membrane fusion protein